MTKRVGVLTTLYDFSSAYSLTSVIESQLVALAKYGYKPVLFTHDNFKDDARVPEGVEVRKVVPRFRLVDYTTQPPEKDLEEQVAAVLEMLREHTKDLDVIIEHDLIFQGWFTPYCVAIHKFSEESRIKWLHWTHSVPNIARELVYPNNLRHTLPKNSKLVYLNNHGLVRAAESYDTFPKDVRIVWNPVDPRLFWNLHPLVSSLIDRYGLLDADLVQTYPLSTTRMVEGKGIDKLIEIFGALKKNGKSVRLVVCNAHANGEREKTAIKQVRGRAFYAGVADNELIFTSQEDAPTYEGGVPREVVSQLFHLSNLFVFPTTSENCSLILLEAMLSKNLLVLNEDVPQLREFGKENALYFRFGGLDNKTLYKDGFSPFANDVAKIIISEFNANRALKAQVDARKHHNLDWVFVNQILPILHEYLNEN